MGERTLKVRVWGGVNGEKVWFCGVQSRDICKGEFDLISIAAWTVNVRRVEWVGGG